MGEYAERKSDGQRIKIGTCESMYYLRYEDRNKVRKEHNNLDAGSELNLFWRLPYPDEDNVRPGDYKEHNRGLRLYKMEGEYTVDFSNPGLGENGHAGIIQISHGESGLLLNLPCHHGEKLPEVGNAKVFWNGKGHSYELAFLKNTARGVIPVYRCRHCNRMWSCDWALIWEYLTPEWKARFARYRTPENSPKEEQA